MYLCGLYIYILRFIDSCISFPFSGDLYANLYNFIIKIKEIECK